MSRIFVRQRRHVGQGAGRPRFTVVAVHGSDLKLKRAFLRRAELEKIAQETGAEIIYLPRGEHGGAGEAAGESGRKRRRRKDED
jgi:hypothetical protein